MSSCSAMRSLSSTVSEMPSSWAPSRSVVSKISTRSGRPASRSTTGSLTDIVEPVLVLLHLAVHDREVGLLDLAGDLARLADLAVVDRAHRHDLGRGAGEERLVGRIEVAAEQVRLEDLVPEIARDRHH